MTNYYLSFNQGQAGGPLNSSNVSEGTSAPVADVIVEFGAKLGIAGQSKSEAVRGLHAIIAYIRADNSVIPWGSQ